MEMMLSVFHLISLIISLIDPCFILKFSAVKMNIELCICVSKAYVPYRGAKLRKPLLLYFLLM